MKRKIFYTSFSFWKKLSQTNTQFARRLSPLSIAFTTPKWWSGQKIDLLTPSKELFMDTHQNGYEPMRYFKAYVKQISSFTRREIAKEIFSKAGELNPVLLGWQQFKVLGQCQFFIAWLYKIHTKDALAFQLSQNIQSFQQSSFFQI